MATCGRRVGGLELANWLTRGPGEKNSMIVIARRRNCTILSPVGKEYAILIPVAEVVRHLSSVLIVFY